MKRTFLAVLLLCLAFLVFLVATVPAQLAAAYLPAQSGVRLIGVSGSLWHGEALSVQYRNQEYGKLQWQLKPLALLTLKLRSDFSLRGEQLNASGTVTVKRDQSIRLDRTELSAQVESLPLPTTAQLAAPTGLLKATINSALINAGRVTEATGVATWSPATISLPAETNLGSIKLELSTDPAGLQGKLSGADSPLNISGTLTLAGNGQLSTNIKLAPNAQTPPELRDMLPMAGRPARDGSITLRQQLKLF